MARKAKTLFDDNEPERMIETSKLISLIRDVCALKERNKSLTGEASEAVKEAVEVKHLHRGAFGLVVKLHRAKDVIARDRAIRAIRYYLDRCEETIWAKDFHVGDMVEMLKGEHAREAARQDEAGEAQAAANAALLEKGIKQLPPAEGGAAPKRRGRPPKNKGDGASSGGYRIQ